jgi:hypothetical protein
MTAEEQLIARYFDLSNRHDLDTVESVSVYASLAFLIACAMPKKQCIAVTSVC